MEFKEINTINILKQKAAEFNIELDNEQIEKFRIYLDFLTEYNQHTNLVSSTEPETMISKHFVDSLALGLAAKELNLNRKLNFIDIGIGGGFPGIPLLIAFPEWKLCAVDSVEKKLTFIKILCEKLDISKRVEIISARAEELARNPAKRNFFDLAVVRAVAKMNIISEYCLPFVKKNGYFAAYKAKTAEEELKDAQKAISLLGGRFISKIKYTLSGEEDRNLILIKKISSTSDKYPRKTGIPTKNPL
ncbi:MAG TPA: 16S rRNA (guanine(527)-N(7))-methyltransferase RsmG [Candidatus Gastranaerophilales bacterium]|nr:16S rRNA (guanine(527)-N(7))-methyltransferase RsmG [Candidatus Gastranaerophilales bacterium]